MSISASIAPHLPYLRRFARALTGSQKTGDAYVVTVLETFLADTSSFPTDVDSRVALYRSFLKIWNGVAINHELATTPDLDAAESGRNLEALTPLPRQAFLLTAVEGFSIPEAALILEVPIQTTIDLLAQAGREIGQQVATDVLIIEDEPLIAIDLESLVQGLGHRVTTIARTHSEAVLAVGVQRPGLVLADIQLADGSSGLDAVNDILTKFDVPVIFITAFPERLLTGNRPEPTFLIGKPFEPSMVRAVISQALFFGMAAQSPARKSVQG
jgi:DNA-directed RNA polymerase specialized sigma24 family protein